MVITSEHIKKAAEELKNLRPVYEPLLDFYEQLFMAQENSKSHTQIKPVLIPDEILSVKIQEKFPLINISEFVIDTEASGALLRKICDIAKAAGGDMSVFAGGIISAIKIKKLDTDMLFSSLIKEDDIFFETASGELEIDKRFLAFITYSSINPSICLCSQKISTCLDKEDTWGKGYCPVCGSPPGLSLLEGEGERFFLCSFCRHKWSARRLYCPFCDNRDSKTLHYTFSEEEKEYRVDLCDICKKYIKTVDIRKTERFIYPPLELIATMHLDIKAKEMGYKSGIPLILET